MTLILKNLLFTVFVPGMVAVAGPLGIAGHRSPSTGPGLVLSIAVLAAGAAIYFWCLWDFAVTGRATPFPLDPPKVLVVRGLYRYTRNPMYVGVLTVIAGWALLFHSWPLALYAACISLAFHLFVVLYEEPHLRRTFGSGYEDYQRTVRRWL